MRVRPSLDLLVFLVAALALVGLVWLVVAIVSDSTLGPGILWLLLPIVVLGLLLNAALGAVLLWERLRRRRMPTAEEGSSERRSDSARQEQEP